MDSEAEMFCTEDDHVYTKEESDYSVLDSEISYVVLNDLEIQSLQRNEIERVSMVLFINEVEASILLHHYYWNVNKIYDDWFSDEQSVRRNVGIFDYRTRVDTRFKCGICFDFYPGKEISTVSCGHSFCNTCWTLYIRNNIRDKGMGCLFLKCPEYNCSAAVGHDMVGKFSAMEDHRNYNWFFLRSYVESKKNMKWCPAPRCNHAIEFVMPQTASKTGVSCYDVTCLCSYKFCWNCSQEAHSPVDCYTVYKWLLKNKEESPDMCWILANSKPCPRCKIPIEKNGGCTHMICLSCRYDFCWLCLCSHEEFCSYEEGRSNQYFDVSGNSQRNQPIKTWSERYLYYHERWTRHESLNDKAMMDLKKLNLVLYKENNSPRYANIFVKEAWLQVIECTRVLKWTYVYGYYYMSEHDDAKQQWYKYLVGEAESCLEKFRDCVEKELEIYRNVDDDCSEDFIKCRTKTIGLTKLNKVYFQNLVKAMENGLAEVVN